ncbi:MAG: glycosyltransferase family 4 protein [Clostridiales bacterium]|nr:glycosyltransferase family 4 protein [Clostridiales bacterium]
MKILYDSQAFGIQKFGGVSRYFYKLNECGKDYFEGFVSGIYSDNIYAPLVSNMKPFPLRNSFKGKSRLINAINQIADIKAIKKGGYDVYHPTYYCVPKYQDQKPMIVTAHDFIHEIYPENFSSKDNTVFCKKKSLERADRIIAISEWTKNDLLKFYPKVKADKIDVVYHAIEWMPREKKTLQLKVKKPYILFTGQRKGYKNFAALAKAAASSMISNDLFLVCTGSPFTEEEKSLFDKLGILNRVFQFFASEDQLRSLYENALFFCFPSLYEGFGFPILEAFVSKCPLLLSHASCFPEIAGDAALYFDPNDEADFKGKVSQLIQSETLRRELVKKEGERLSVFSIPKMIEKTAAVYTKALE